jgi:uncharacterized phage protein (TIGR01671 family)
MNDRYKFRGLTKEGKEVKGSLILSKDNLRACIGYIEPLDDGGEVCIVCYDGVLPDSVVEFTGIKDKNGKDIYERDLVRLRGYYGWKVEPVIYNEKYGCWQIGEKHKHGMGDKGGGPRLLTGSIEVIGNIHQTPELLA